LVIWIHCESQFLHQELGEVLPEQECSSLLALVELLLSPIGATSCLFSFNDLIYHALVIWIHCESQFLHQELGEVLPEQECSSLLSLVELLLSPIGATSCLDSPTLLLFQEHVVVKDLLSVFSSQFFSTHWLDHVKIVELSEFFHHHIHAVLFISFKALLE
jgi:hypothetical protein